MVEGSERSIMSVRIGYRNFFALLGLACLLASGCARKSPVPDVVVASDAGWHERAAASEVRRYIYLRAGVLPALKEAASLPASLTGPSSSSRRAESRPGLDDPTRPAGSPPWGLRITG
jgi:hypothetical protein